MEYSKAMIDIVREIRKRVDKDLEPTIKLANQQLLNDLVPVYEQSKDTVLRIIIKELFLLAGDEWPEKIAT